MAEYTSKAALYEKFAELEREARETLVRTASGTSAYTRNSTRLSAFTMAKHIVADFPAADVASVVHGRWVWETADIYRCTVCNTKAHVKEVMNRPAWDYCPNCGARMDGEADGSD